MAKRKLKVFKTPTGFHDAYVAAPSRKAALEAWGAGTDLFSAGIAEEVKQGGGQPATEALEKPGEVVRVSRSGKDSPSTSPGRAGKGKPAKPSRKKPSRAALDKAEAALAELEKTQSAERAELENQEAALARKREGLEEKHRKARERAEAKRDAAEERYRDALG